MSKLNINEVGIGNKIAIMDFSHFNCDNSKMVSLIEVVKITKVDEHLYEITTKVTDDYPSNEYIFDDETCEIYTDITEAIDRIRYYDSIKNFNKTTYSWYLEFIIDYIKNQKHIWVIRKSKAMYTGKDEYDLHECAIEELFLDYKTKKFNVKTNSLKSCTRSNVGVDKFGDKLFFNRSNAIDRYNSLVK